jgi:hypothetical protein
MLTATATATTAPIEATNETDTNRATAHNTETEDQ